ncbi:MAG: argininosuccinate lyase [Tropicimonas sp.]|uniref:argininosuccinate lyase n=1 Tax=Tropicimonas sp. TaxID=2067044 RepID=UPI003A890711
MRQIQNAPLRGALLAALLSLAGCGADGPPIPPDNREHPAPGATVSGSVEVGMVGGSG